jgi:hypothetical protein
VKARFFIGILEVTILATNISIITCDFKWQSREHSKDEICSCGYQLILDLDKIMKKQEKKYFCDLITERIDI